MADSEMAPRLWSGLPNEVQDRLLPFLTVPVLCRFRTVCKRWDIIIRSSKFRALCIKHGNAQGYILGCDARGRHRSTAQFSNSLGWRLLDVKANRWYFLKPDEEESCDLPRDCFESRSLAMDGGLACAYYLDPMTQVPRVRVSNPIAKVLARLPASPYAYQVLPGDAGNQRIPFLMSMVVEHGEDFEAYKIFEMCCALHETFDIPSIVVYDSTTGSWKRGSTKFAGNTRVVAVRCIVFFQGFLYALISNPTPYDIDGFWELWRYSPDKDEWTKVTGAKKHFHKFFQLVCPQLIVSGDRLFLVSWVSMSRVTAFEVIEIVPEEGRWRSLIRFPKRQMEEVFETNFTAPQAAAAASGSGTDQTARSSDHFFAESPDITAFGFKESIVLIARKTGLSKEVNLVTCSLVEERPFAKSCEKKSSSETVTCEHQVWYGQPMRLLPHHDKTISKLRKKKDAEVIALSDSDD